MNEEYIHEYIFSGSLPENASTYVAREADEELYEALRQGKFCYVLNSRQSGKSSLRVRTMSRLSEAGVECASIDLSSVSIQSATQENWYADLIVKLIDSFDLDVDFQQWWEKNQLNSSLLRFGNFLEKKLLGEIRENIVIFIDEIDSVLSLKFPTDDFFAFIRSCYNQRVDNPAYNRLTFCLLGVASPSNLIEDKQRTPFNIGKAISLKGFQLHEVKPLQRGLEGKFSKPQAVMQKILEWTGGQPFLTQKLCQFMVEESEQENPRTVEQVVKSRIIENWESQDEPEHLRTIQARILRDEQRAGYLLELYQQIRLMEDKSEITADDTLEQSELQLSGLVVRQQNKLRVYNPIYQEVFDSYWVENQLTNLRPYSENFRFWVASGGTDESRLLRGKALQDAVEWAKDKSLSYQDRQFLAASQAKEREEEVAALEQEAALERERQDREAAEKRNQVLAEANKKAQRRISIGTVVLILTLVITAILGIIAGKEVVKARSAREEAKQAQQAQKEAEETVTEATKKTLQAQAKATVAEDRATKATQTVQQTQQEVALATVKLTKAQQDAQAANENEKAAKQRVQQAKQEVALATAKLEKAQQDAQAANQNEKAAKQRVQQAKQEVTSAKLEIKQTKQEIQNVSQLSALGGELYKAQKQSEAEQAWRQASLSFEIRDYRLKQAMLLSNISVAYEQLGKLTEANKAVSDSLKLLQTDVDKKNSTDRLVILAQALNNKGRLLASQGNTQEALSAHTEAFNSLQSLGSDLTSINPAIQVSFADTVERVYRGLIGSLLQSRETVPNQQNLKKARQLIESLQLTELNNFRQLAFFNANLREIDEIDPKAAVIYPIVFDDRLEIILHLPQQPLRHYSIISSAKEVESIISRMQESMAERLDDKYLDSSEKVYNLLIRPIEADLAKTRSKTLVFVLDAPVRNIPIAALYDTQSKQYLVQKYAIALTPTLQIIEPQSYLRRPLKALIAGVSKEQQGFSSLPGVESEVKEISSMISSKVLLNQAFTSTALKKAINLSSVPIVHLATHGQDRSNPEDTFLLAWDEKITAKDFEQLLHSREQDKSDPIELLVLSACETAKNGNRATSGLAGLALRSGVHSTLAILWSAEDRSTSKFMVRFYQELNKPGVTKAEALSRAQVASINTEKYEHPYNWAPFVLIGDWR
jgi:CHAT domain-containing protein